MKKLLLLAIVVLGFAAVSFGQDNTSTVSDANASATILKALQIKKGTSELNFGVIGAKTDATSTVTLAADGTLGGDATKYTGFGVSASPAVFIIEGTPNAGFNLLLPESIPLVNALVGGSPMSITNLVTNLTGTSGRSDKLDEKTGILTLNVGGTLNVGMNQASGTYTATYEVTVNYN